ncbi:MAG: hypothetical protein KGQ52_13560 [Alphaproteobacteria bacterium]|nr:hypothetical protein [Alphaproteobacteria bacterium]
MPFTSTDLDSIDSAIASGVRRVTFADGRTTEYQDADAMRAARALIVSELSKQDQAAAGTPPRRMRFLRYNNGLG